MKECALRARSTHGVHHAIVEVNIVIGVVRGEVLVARVVPLVVDAVIGLALGLIAHVVIVVFVVAIFHRILLYWRYTVGVFSWFWWCSLVGQDPQMCAFSPSGCRAKTPRGLHGRWFGGSSSDTSPHQTVLHSTFWVCAPLNRVQLFGRREKM